MLDYVINLLDDAQDFSWSSAKASHAVLLWRMEQKEIGGWSEVEKIDRVRRAHAQRRGNPQAVQNVKTFDKNQNSLPSLPLVFISIRMHVHKLKIMRTKAFLQTHLCCLLGAGWKSICPFSVGL